MREIFEYFFEHYKYDFNKSRNKDDGDNSVSKTYYTNDLKDRFKKSIGADDLNYTVDFGLGSGRWTYNPYIVIRNPAFSMSPQNSYYVVYIFNTDMNKVFLSLNRGGNHSSNIDKEEETLNVEEELIISKYWRNELNYPRNLFNIDKLNIGARTIKTRGYETRSIIAKEYIKQNLPSNNVLLSDLRNLIKVYDDLICKVALLGESIYEAEHNILKKSRSNLENSIGGSIEVEADSNQTENPMTEFLSDTCSGIDLLRIEKDVNSLAELMTMKSVKPPLSIGIFGKWGSGKSFYITKIQEKVKSIVADKTKRDYFCEKVVQINFNAWHYIDSNLWASLAQHIFEMTGYYIKREKNYEEGDSRKDGINYLLDELKIKEAYRDEIDRKKLNLEKDKTIGIDYNRIKDEVSKKLEQIYPELNIDLNKFDFKKIKNNYYKIIEIIKLVYFKKSSLKYWGILTISALIITILIYRLLREKFVTFYIPLAIITLVIDVARRCLKVSRILDVISFSHNESYEKVKQKKREIDNEIQNLNFELEKLKNSNYFENIIEDRIKSKKYENELGIINIIRKDFGKLSEYLKNQNESDPQYRVDRIIIYIDDLDRCTPEKVIEVLQAVHLLLSFECFVVVLAVDMRWVSKCLKIKYKDMFKDNNRDGNLASSYDYIEKIIQIPVKINDMNDSSKENYILGLLDNTYNDMDSDNDGNNVDKNKEDDKTLEEVAVTLDTQTSISNRVNINNTSEEINEVDFEDESKNEDDGKIYKRIEITKEEIEDMKIFMPLLSNTPRSLKRFINIYKLIKVKNNISNSDRLAGLFILSIVTTSTKNSEKLLKIIKEYDEEKKVKDILAIDVYKGLLNENNIFQDITINQRIEEITVESLKKVIPEIEKYSFY